MNSLNQIAVPFHSNELLVVEYNNQPYTPMKPIVEGMGLAWQAQYDKLKQRFSSVIMEIMTTGKDGKSYNMICLPLKKLFGWLMTISPNKVKPELRDTVIMYQNECDDVLWDYWTKGQAINSRESISPEQQALLHEIVARRSGGERKVFAEMWARHNRHFKIPRYSELLTVHFPEAVHYLETMELKAKTVKQEVKSLPYPQEVMQIAKQISHEFKGGQFKNWLVTENNGLLSIQALAHGYYPTIDIAEFTKRFDSLLDLLYGSDTLRVGRHFLAERKRAKF
ncbi:phage antirepressor N-terminal domain-containing protein [Acinetobacter soli]|uniref:phage antirepressor N-terminal domain-containing protein n=1 Tax=Acinetobacter soli TaxID=487316 RepID=UPI00280F21C7|nr:phage antirepressor N-terminal domain-containing protein [Acinetobacter soli]MDQ8942240.1 phage antirepressor N-terminal domain-containing protein [Acinetobacter soli]